YPFTTLVPHLGVVRCGEDRSFVLADVPGLIPGAHEGHGLGDRFLRHLMRTRLLVHLLDLSGLSGSDPLADYEAIHSELRLFDPALASRPKLVVGNKIDLAESRERLDTVRREIEQRGLDFLAVSAVTGEGVAELVRRICVWMAGQEPPPETTSVEAP
ncbi:MAG: GTPase, partial [Candidatus Binatia bacterium]